VGQPPHGPYHATPAKGGTGSRRTVVSPTSAPPSRQNTWTAQETYHEALAASLCTGLEGAALVTCAETRTALWPEKRGQFPAFSSGIAIASPEEFTYKRFYDVEHWMDEIAACRDDFTCKANVSLDPRRGIGIAGTVLTADDPQPQQASNFVLAASKVGIWQCGDPNASPPVPPNAGLSADQLLACAFVQSAPPVGYVTASLVAPVAGAGAAGPWMVDNGLQPANVIAPSPAYDPHPVAPPGGVIINAQVSQGYWAQKNPYYDAQYMITPMLVRAFAADPAKSASMQRLVAELANGQSYYYVGKNPAGIRHAPVAKKSYPDEWAFQRAMRDANAARGTLPGEYIDYAKRKKYLEHRAATWGLLNQMAQLAMTAWAAPNQKAAARKRVVRDMVSHKPTISGAMPNPALSARIGTITPTITPTAADTAAWGNNPPQLDPAYPYPRVLCTAPDHVAAGYSPRVSPATVIVSGGQAAAAAYQRAAACEYVNAVLDEWARRDSYQALAGADTAAGPSGCFSGDPACDWSPQDLMAGLDDLLENQIQNVQSAQREADYKAAKGWWKKISNPSDPACVARDPHTHQPVNPPMNFCQGALTSENNFLTAIRSVVTSAFAAIRQVPVLNQGSGTGANGSASFGERRQNGENFGNDTFGVGYDYTLAWDLPMQWKGGNVCDFGAGASGSFEAYAYAFGSDKFDIIKADFLAGVHDAMTDTQTPDEGRLNGELVLAGDSLFSLEPPSGVAPVNRPLATFPLAQGSNSTIIVVLPFQISFVTLTIQVGVGYSYAVNATVSPTHVDGCTNGGKPSLGLQGTIDPNGDLNAIIDADVGIGPPGLADVGIEVDLTLLGVGLPVTAGVNMEVQQGNLLTLGINEGLNMDFHTLDGSLSVFADLLFIRLFDITILSWAGLHHTIPLFNATQNVLLTDLTTLGPNLQGPQLNGL
jgi:hypothetical protein